MHLYATQRSSYHEINVSLLIAEVIHQSLKAMLLFTNLKQKSRRKLQLLLFHSL